MAAYQVARGPASARGGMWAAGLFCLALLVIYHETVASLVRIWSRSDTFAHGFLILPISLWLIWRFREQLGHLKPEPALRVALVVIPLSAVWLVARLVDIDVIQQLVMIAMMVTGVWAVLGHRLAGLLAFPLFFLFFAVPMGEELIAPMMEFTASSTVWMVEMTGIPVYREGLNFALPSGRWAVVEACSGVRYILASVTVGTLYAYLTYRSWTRRAIFVLVSALMPVLANSIRAYIIVMLGHISNMTVATGVDHFVYGWFFFGLVMFLLFWLGAFFRESDLVPVLKQPGIEAKKLDSGASNGMLLLVVLYTLMMASVAPFLVYTTALSSASEARSITLPSAQGAWQLSMASKWFWRPPATVSGLQSALYSKEGEMVVLLVQYPDGTNEGADIVDSSNLFTLEDSEEQIVGQAKIGVRILRNEVIVDEVRVRGVEDELLVWSWYLMGDLDTSSKYLAKFQDARARLGFGETGAYRIVVATPVRASLADTRSRLQDFLDEYSPLLYQELRHTATMAP
jgi:exosortase A